MTFVCHLTNLTRFAFVALIFCPTKGDTKQHGKITADAFEIQVAASEAGLLRSVLEVAFGLPSNQNDYVFVPYSLRSDNSAVYAQLLGKQNDYMQNHRNISLAGITDGMMTKPPAGDQAFKDKLQDQPGVYRVDPTRRLLDLGKWNISTDSQHYQALQAWIDTEMPKYYANAKPSGKFTDFPVPTRLGKHRAEAQSIPSAYSAQLCQKYGDTDTAPTVQPARQAWQRPPVDIEYSLKNADFPALSNKNSDQHKIEDTKSTASSTRLTVSEDYKSLIGKELAQFKEEALSARSELSQLKLDMSQMMKDTIHQELPLIVSKIQQQSVSVYLTASEYKADMIALQSNFQTALQAQTDVIRQLSNQMKDMQDNTKTRKRPAPSPEPSRPENSPPPTPETNDTPDSDNELFSPASTRPEVMQE